MHRKLIYLLVVSTLVSLVGVGCTKKPGAAPIESPIDTPAPTIDTVDDLGKIEVEPSEISNPIKMTQEEVIQYLSTFKWTPGTKEIQDADKYLTSLVLSHLLYTDEAIYVPTIDNEVHKVRAIPQLAVMNDTYYLSINLVGSEPVSQIHFSKISESVPLNIETFKNPLNVLLFYNENLITNCVN